MLHSLIIMTGAGVTIFEKTWVDKFDDKVKFFVSKSDHY